MPTDKNNTLEASMSSKKQTLSPSTATNKVAVSASRKETTKGVVKKLKSENGTAVISTIEEKVDVAQAEKQGKLQGETSRKGSDETQVELQEQRGKPQKESQDESQAELPPNRAMIKPKGKGKNKQWSEYLQETKRMARSMEKNNFSKIIAFDSGAPWYKIAFFSNLIYQFHVMPHLKQVYFEPRADNDFYSFSKTGVTSISDIVCFAEALKKMGAKIPKSLERYFDGTMPELSRPLDAERERFYVFEFEGLTRADVEAFLKSHEQRISDLNKLVLPAYIPQDLYADAHRMAEIITVLVTKMPNVIRETFGRKLIDLALVILQDINATCNGYGDGEKTYAHALNTTLYRCAHIQEAVRVLLDTGQIKITVCQSLLRMTLKVQEDAKKELSMLADSQNTPVEKIKRAKNFPRTDGVNLDKIIKNQSVRPLKTISTRPPVA